MSSSKKLVCLVMNAVGKNLLNVACQIFKDNSERQMVKIMFIFKNIFPDYTT